MRYQVSGKQIDIGEALQAHVQSEIDAVVEKYSSRPTDALCVFSRDGSGYCCETVLHLSSGMTVQARATNHDIYGACDAAVAKMEKQLRRYKRRLKNHNKERTTPVELFEASSYILASSESEEDAEPDTLQPVIVAEMETRIPTLSVGEAVMQMELHGAPVLVFRNEKQGSGVNVVYRREDGNVGWIDPNTAG
ncbi:ribosome hibernation-promoting factor, HPF/YfiA family [Palleronia sp.]|uniref:ribosome hibernation-promoting factor, HPF/YfiA family n=1 Tax=Palleronia sp. TaxID=1940284 RepID=UPI0035C8268F